jgi:hypothetical protein
MSPPEKQIVYDPEWIEVRSRHMAKLVYITDVEAV